MGKSGHIGGKIAATLASTGTPAFFVHAGEASHGDVGMITRDDAVLALSNSGETDEILTIVPVIKRLGVPLIAFTGNSTSALARVATVHVDIGVPAEACPLNLAPTASTTAALAVGDALAVSLLKARGFTEEDFARSHPAGTLGRRLLLHVKDVMRTGARVAEGAAGHAARRGSMEMTRKGLGMTAIVDERDRMLGVFTDGDLRRALDRAADLHRTRMDRGHDPPRKNACTPNTLAAEAVLLDGNSPHHLADRRRCGRGARRRTQRARPAARRCRLSGRASARLAAHATRHPPARQDRTAGCSMSTACSPTGGCISRARGEALKAFHVRDGHGIKLLMQSGVAVAAVSGRRSAAVTARMRELGVRHVVQGCSDKVAALARSRRAARHRSAWPAPASSTTRRTCR